MELNALKGPELVATYNKLAAKVAAKPVKRFGTRKEAIARIEKLKTRPPSKYPLAANKWHAMNPEARNRARREVIEAVFNHLKQYAVPQPGTSWATVKLAEARIEGMDALIWAGHLCQLRKEGRYKRIKGKVGAIDLSATEG